MAPGNVSSPVARSNSRAAASGSVVGSQAKPWNRVGCRSTSSARVKQTSNAYVLTFPVRAMAPNGCRIKLLQRALLSDRSAGNTGCRFGQEEGDRKIPPVTASDRVAALAALEAVRVAREAAMTARWWAIRQRSSSQCSSRSGQAHDWWAFLLCSWTCRGGLRSSDCQYSCAERGSSCCRG